MKAVTAQTNIHQQRGSDMKEKPRFIYSLAYKGPPWYVLYCTNTPALLIGPEELKPRPGRLLTSSCYI